MGRCAAQQKQIEALQAGQSQVLEMLRHREAVVRAVANASQRFLRTTSWRQQAQDVLEDIGQATCVSRVCIFENGSDRQGRLHTRQLFEWAAPNVTPEIHKDKLQCVPYRDGGFSRWEEILGRGDVVCGYVRDFPASEQAVLAPQDILSIVVVPIFTNNSWWGFIGFDACCRQRQWDPMEIDALEAAAGAFAAAIQREWVEDAVKGAYDDLEGRVQQHTVQLTVVNEQLQQQITQRRQAEEARRRNENRYRALYDNNPSMYFTVDERGIVTSVNRFGADQLGYTAGQPIGQSVLKVVHEADHDKVRDQLAVCLRQPDSCCGYSERCWRSPPSVWSCPSSWTRCAALSSRCCPGP